MAKLILLLVLGLVALNAWRNWRVSRIAQPDRREPDDVSNPIAGVLFAIVVASVLLFALFVLPGLMDRLP
jgi:hypothetical protein